jgi:NAD(P)-dependent dehydrogenase (short-subunit alcohol dehydrogenase family)
LATATYLAQRGVPVYATVRTDADRDRVGAIPGVEAFVCDVTDDGQVAALRAAIDQRGDGLWGIVHNAGIGYLGHLTATPLEAMKQVFEVNVFGVHRVTNAFIDLILASRGRIVTISSLSGTLSSALMGAYSMSKHAVEAYTDALAAQMEPHGVRVVAVAPGNYDSRIVANAVGRFEAPADATPEVRALFEDPNAQDRSAFPPPDDVAEACRAALFDEAPLARYLVVPVADEADRTLAQAAGEWARLNASTPYRWAVERLVEEVETAGER